VVWPDTAAVVVAVPASREPEVPVGADSDSVSAVEVSRRPVWDAGSAVEPAADCVTHDGAPLAAAREYDRDEAVSPTPDSLARE
jgi:hypothetical protein